MKNARNLSKRMVHNHIKTITMLVALIILFSFFVLPIIKPIEEPKCGKNQVWFSGKCICNAGFIEPANTQNFATPIQSTDPCVPNPCKLQSVLVCGSGWGAKCSIQDQWACACKKGFSPLIIGGYSELTDIRAYGRCFPDCPPGSERENYDCKPIDCGKNGYYWYDPDRIELAYSAKGWYPIKAPISQCWCKTGYYWKDVNEKCVPICKENEYYIPIGPWDHKCECKFDAYRDKTGKCVRFCTNPQQFPKNGICDFCKESGNEKLVENQCVCKDGFTREKSGKCISKCKTNEVWTNNGCTCKEWFERNRYRDCVIKCPVLEELVGDSCMCKKGFDRDDNGQCADLFGIDPSKHCKEDPTELIKMLKVISDFKGASLDGLGFWGNLKANNPWWGTLELTRPLAYYTFGWNGLYVEDGKDRPIRTGYEGRLYRSIKYFVKTQPGEKITMPKLLQLGLGAVVDGGGVANIQLAALTIHNVIRFLARPDLWKDTSRDGKSPKSDWRGYPPNDPMYEIFLDLRNIEASGGGPSLPELRKQPLLDRDIVIAGQLRTKGEVKDPGWTIALFDLNNGIFLPRTGVPEASRNAGSYYYYWVGVVAKLILPPGGSSFGKYMEIYVGKGNVGDNYIRALIQTAHMDCGVKFAEEVLGTVFIESSL